ncbi:uncharacterized protein L969DRAFT_51188 [Mixia osmundae IAM 14324]|uniref:AAA+ ATPase domain-containing protein n=1 Tax=Mixia osmundae (strain CBS 9802 / IAM 14324 / JCM 22182 / KY 12970) TaxID=764103 RepID=G7E7U1_MIXOS|nr:uncharacterized protein L969DRAFT_51188 [Mixia osmundae IAM 14324]KEI38502.1 hypothetical protein L969DRAFT_51188 [Mixia osmundae IAM 14324]GAA98901.1 hypothetical protein E5Q_05589 [Mixia osmundae IAM 14324]
MTDRPRAVLHLEAKLKADSTARHEVIKRMLSTYLLSNYATLESHTILEPGSSVSQPPPSTSQTEQADPTEPRAVAPAIGWREIGTLDDHLELVRLAEIDRFDNDDEADELESSDLIMLAEVDLEIHIYQLVSMFEAPLKATLDEEDPDASCHEETAARVIRLPSQAHDGLWSSLIFPPRVKRDLLNFMTTSAEFARRGVDTDIIASNRLLLLHGPPGTGKTSLCIALAQKLSIRLSDIWPDTRLIEINSHSLISRWFSESGKLVQRLFSQIFALADTPTNYIVVLIDEVESLTAARASALNGKEPSDALRVVNALLTQLDQLRRRRNVLVLATSNLAQAIDPAFLDRADMKQYIDLPHVEAIHWILQTCFVELMRAQLVDALEMLTWKQVRMLEGLECQRGGSGPSENASRSLVKLAHACRGLSGRALRRLPILSHAKYLSGARKHSVFTWIDAMHRVATDLQQDIHG